MAINWTKLNCPEGYAAVAMVEQTDGLFRMQIKKIISDEYEIGDYVYLSNPYDKIGVYNDQEIYIVPVSAVKSYEKS